MVIVTIYTIHGSYGIWAYLSPEESFGSGLSQEELLPCAPQSLLRLTFFWLFNSDFWHPTPGKKHSLFFWYSLFPARISGISHEKSMDYDGLNIAMIGEVLALTWNDLWRGKIDQHKYGRYNRDMGYNKDYTMDTVEPQFVGKVGLWLQ